MEEEGNGGEGEEEEKEERKGGGGEGRKRRRERWWEAEEGGAGALRPFFTWGSEGTGRGASWQPPSRWHRSGGLGNERHLGVGGGWRATAPGEPQHRQ